MVEVVENKEVVYDGSTPLDSPIKERFAHAVVDGKSQSDAYRKVFEDKEISKESVWDQASKLSRELCVSTRIRFLRKTLTDECIWTREDSVRALKEIAHSEYEDENGKARKEHLAKDRVAATVALNKMSGFDAPAKVEVTGANGSPLGLADFFAKEVDK